MRRFLQILLILCIIALAGIGLWSWYGSREEDKPEGNILSAYRYLGSARGFFVPVGEDGDFPSAPGLDADGQKAELDAIVAFAKDSGFNAIFYEALPGAEAWYRSQVHEVAGDITAQDKVLSKFDPLDYLVKKAAENRVQVFAVADGAAAGAGTDEERAVATLAELTKGYGLAGVLLDLSGLPRLPAEELDSLARAARRQMEKTATGVALGLIFDGMRPEGPVTPELLDSLTGDGTVQMALPRVTTAVDDPESPYASVLEQWTSAMAGEDARLYTVNAAWMLGGEEGYKDPEELSYQLFTNSLYPSVAGAVIESYSDIKGDREETELLVSFLTAARNPLPDLTLTIPRTLAVTYPASDITTTDSAIFLMGTSDPAQDLTMNGQEVERISQGGAYGVKADLSLGANTFTFRQGETSAKVTITRRSPSTGASTISGITASTLFPRYGLGVDSNETVELSCVGPAGGRITATLGGMTVELGQAAAAAQDGVPATFKGSITLNPANYPADETKNIGRITYNLTYGG